LTSFNVEEGKDLEIYGKNILKTQKLLIVMLWSYELNEKYESPYVSPKYINEASEVNGTCIKSVIEYFGIENIVVVDYESAIKELLKKNEKGECIYYSVWIFCGPQYPILPPINGKENSTNPYLVEEFINILIIFWTNGGSLVFFAEGDPLYFQVNLFLEKVEFSKNEKPKFRISGNYYGDKTLTQDKEGKMDKEGIFDKSKKKSTYKGIEIQRQSLSHNLGLIFEGLTISYAVDKNSKKIITIKEKEKLYPFRAFSINSEGGISTLIYESDQKGRGDIIIDCGYTKCFLNMKRDGTFKYIQNLAGWTARPEINFTIEKIYPWEWRPKGINYKVDYNSHYNGYLKYENKNIKEMKTLFAIDRSGSTSFNLYEKEVINLINNYYEEERGDIIYIWGDSYKKLTKEELLLGFKEDDDLGSTYPKLIVYIMEEEQKNNFKHLMIITDGNVSDYEINEVDEIMEDKNYNFEFVSVYIIGDEGDLSVGAPFCRRTPNKTYIKKNESETEFKEMATLNKEDMMILEKIEKYDNYSDFMDNYHKIKNAVQAKCIGTLKNKELENKLETLFNNISQKQQNNLDEEFFKRKNILIGMTQGSLQKAFTIENINAAIKNYTENSDDKKIKNMKVNNDLQFLLLNRILNQNIFPLDINNYMPFLFLKDLMDENEINIDYKNDKSDKYSEDQKDEQKSNIEESDKNLEDQKDEYKSNIEESDKYSEDQKDDYNSNYKINKNNDNKSGDNSIDNNINIINNKNNINEFKYNFSRKRNKSNSSFKFSISIDSSEISGPTDSKTSRKNNSNFSSADKIKKKNSENANKIHSKIYNYLSKDKLKKPNI